MPFQKIRRMIRSSDLRPDLPQTPDSDIEAFVSHYVVAALWMETDGDGTSLDSLYGPADLSEDASRQCVDECIDFLRQSLGGSDVATALSTEPAASGGSGGLTAAEQALLAQIPRDFQPYCRRSNLPDGSLGGDLASLRCDLPLDTSSAFGADSVWYDAFSTPGLVAITMNGVAEREKLPVGECGPDSGAAVGSWSMGITFTGQLACYAKNGAAWIVWTYDGEQIAARAVRRDGDAKRLYTWWHEEASIYLR